MASTLIADEPPPSCQSTRNQSVASAPSTDGHVSFLPCLGSISTLSRMGSFSTLRRVFFHRHSVEQTSQQKAQTDSLVTCYLLQADAGCQLGSSPFAADPFSTSEEMAVNASHTNQSFSTVLVDMRGNWPSQHANRIDSNQRHVFLKSKLLQIANGDTGHDKTSVCRLTGPSTNYEQPLSSNEYRL